MPLIGSVPIQHRTFSHTYFLKNKNPDTLCMRVYGTGHNLLQKVPIQRAQFDTAEQQGQFTNLQDVVTWLVERDVLDKTYAIASTALPKAEHCTDTLAAAADRLKSPLLLEIAEKDEHLTCPITRELFKNPVIDEHGHTFERSAIEEHLRIRAHSGCPLNRQPIDILIPNLVIKGIIAEILRGEPIPTFNLFEQEDNDQAGNQITSAQNSAAGGDIQGALVYMTNAFKCTNRPEDYMSLVTLLEASDRKQEAAYARLYLAGYYLRDGKTPKAVQILEQGIEQNPMVFEQSEVLLQLYLHKAKVDDAVELILQTAANINTDTSWLKAACITTLEYAPSQLELYPTLAEMCTDPVEQRQVLLKGVLHSLANGDSVRAERLFRDFAEKSGGDLIMRPSIEDGLPSLRCNLHLIDQMIKLAFAKDANGNEDRAQLVRELRGLAEECQFFEDHASTLKTYKMLAHLTGSVGDYEQVISGYTRLDKNSKLPKWHLALLDKFISQGKWEEAGSLAQNALKITENALPILECLEHVYPHTEEAALEELWASLGNMYTKGARPDQAERVYQLAFDRFETFDFGWKLAGALKTQEKSAEAVRVYFAASELDLLLHKGQRLGDCVREIKALDSRMRHLDSNQRMHLLTQERLVFALQELKENKNEAASLSASIEKLERERDRANNMKFGDAKWNIHFGDVGAEPPLPDNINEILGSPCPFWPGCTVEQTHVLMLIPAKIKSSDAEEPEPFTLDKLGMLIQHPKTGPAAKYSSYNRDTRAALGNQAPEHSYWILMTRNILPNTRNKKFAEQHKILQTVNLSIKESPTGGGLIYDVPGALEAATAILMEHVATGTHLYGKDAASGHTVATYTRCREQVGEKSFGPRRAVGGFRGGLYIGGDGSIYGLAGVRKLKPGRYTHSF